LLALWARLPADVMFALFYVDFAGWRRSFVLECQSCPFKVWWGFIVAGCLTFCVYCHFLCFCVGCILHYQIGGPFLFLERLLEPPQKLRMMKHVHKVQGWHCSGRLHGLMAGGRWELCCFAQGGCVVSPLRNEGGSGLWLPSYA
jgi:hypothetical protein